MKTSLILLASLLAPLIPLPAAENPKPNLVVIQTDEHNFRTLGCYRALLPEDQAFVWGPGVKGGDAESRLDRAAWCTGDAFLWHATSLHPLARRDDLRALPAFYRRDQK